MSIYGLEGVEGKGILLSDLWAFNFYSHMNYVLIKWNILYYNDSFAWSQIS